MPVSVRSIMSGIGATVQAVDAVVRQALEEAYKRGFDEGAAAMRSSILTAAQSASLDNDKSEQIAPQQALLLQTSNAEAVAVRRKPGTRAQSGTIGKAVDDVFREYSGLSVVGLHDKVRQLGILASKEGVGVHLRRHENVLYLRKGRLWFPIKGNHVDPENAVSGANNAPDTPSNQEGEPIAS